MIGGINSGTEPQTGELFSSEHNSRVTSEQRVAAGKFKYLYRGTNGKQANYNNTSQSQPYQGQPLTKSSPSQFASDLYVPAC